MVLLLNGFGSTSLILICGHFLLANGACMGVIAGVIVVYMGIEKNSIYGPACCSAIVAFFTKLWKINKYIKNNNLFNRILFKERKIL